MINARTARLLATALIALPILPSPAPASCIESQKQALQLIWESADRLCNTVSQESVKAGSSVSGEITTETDKLLGKVIGLKGEVGAKAEEVRSTGVLQEQLASALKDNANCRQHVFDQLYAKLIPSCDSPPPSTPQPARIDLTKILADSTWKVGDWKQGVLENFDEAPWIFHSSGTVSCPGHWTGTWKPIGVDRINVHLVDAQQQEDDFEVELVSDQEFTAWRDGKRFRRGVRR